MPVEHRPGGGHTATAVRCLASGRPADLLHARQRSWARRPSWPAPQGRTMIDDETEAQSLEVQMDLAMEGVREAVLRLLQDGDVHPQLVVLAVARGAGELGACFVPPAVRRAGPVSRS